MNRNGTVEPNEWEAGIVKAKYKVCLYPHLRGPEP